MFRWAAFILLLTVIAAAPRSADAHPFHVSVGEMQFDAETNTLEFALQVWPADLERSIKRRMDAEIDLDDQEDSTVATTDKMITEYLQAAFEVVGADKQALPLQWVGREADGSHIWLYFEVSLGDAKQLGGLQFVNRICFESLRDQVNSIKFQHEGKRRVLKFTREEPAITLDLEDE